MLWLVPFRSRSWPGWRRRWGNPTVPSLLYKSYSRYRTMARWLKTCRALRRFAIESAGVHEIFHGLFEAPAASVQIHIDSDARCTITRQAQDLSLCWRVVRIKAGAHQHLFAIERPAFDKNTVLVLTPDLVAQMIRH